MAGGQKSATGSTGALGALGNLHSWYRPDGPLSLDQIATEVADVLLQPFLTAG